MSCVIPNPGKQVFIGHGAIGNAQTGGGDIIIGAFHMDAVDIKEGQRDIHSDVLAAVHKSVVGNQRMA